MKKFVDDTLSKSEERKEQLKKQLENIVAETLKKMNLVTRSDFEALQKKLDELSEKQQQTPEV